MRVLICLAAICASSSSAADIPADVMGKIKSDALVRGCWGDEAVDSYAELVESAADACMAREPEVEMEDVFQNLAEATPTPEEVGQLAKVLETHFRSGYDVIRREEVLKWSNLTCAMKEAGLWTKEGEINMENYREDLWEGLDVSDAFRTKMTAEYENCKKLSDALDVGPTKFFKTFGRQIYFNKCTIKAEDRVCAMKHALDVLEASFETPLTSELIDRLGLPGDKLEAAMVKYQVIPLLHAPARRFAVDMILEGESSTPFM